MRTRTLIAGLTAPIIGITAGFIVLGFWTKDPRDSSAETVRHFASWLGAFLLFGVPMVWVLEAAIGIPLYRYMQQRNAVAAGPVVLTATATGILALLLPLTLLGGGRTSDFFELSLLGGIGGLVTGAWFWVASGWGRPAPAV